MHACSFINSTMIALPLASSVSGMVNATTVVSGSITITTAIPIATASSALASGVSAAASASSSAIVDPVAPKADVGGALDSLAQLVLAYGEMIAANAAAVSSA